MSLQQIPEHDAELLRYLLRRERAHRWRLSRGEHYSAFYLKPIDRAIRDALLDLTSVEH